jgi:hypothetical protein
MSIHTTKYTMHSVQDTIVQVVYLCFHKSKSKEDLSKQRRSGINTNNKLLN